MPALRVLAQTTAPANAGPAPARPAPAAAASPGDLVPTQRQTFGIGRVKVAVLLETLSPAFGKATAAVMAGIRSAHARDGQGIMLEFIPISERGEELEEALREFSERGFAMAIGPLTRNGVNLLTEKGELPLPMLALNQPDADRHPPNNLIVFSLAIESEGRQVARAAYDDAAQRVPGRRPLRALAISNGTPLAKRGLAAFSDAWRELGGALVDPIETESRNPVEIKSLLARSSCDLTFAAVGTESLRAIRVALPREIPVYGTSQLNAVMPGAINRNTDLDGVRLVDMPWQVLPDHVAVMSYPKAVAFGHLDFQRLYALGIDAFRITRELLQHRSRFEIDGVTGRLKIDLAADVRVDRTSVLAEFRNGVVVPLEPR